MGARRPTALCRHLTSQGWDVRMLSMGEHGEAVMISQFEASPVQAEPLKGSSEDPPAGLRKRLEHTFLWEGTRKIRESRTRVALAQWPDSRGVRPWRRSAFALARKGPRSDVVVSSAPVPSSHLLASQIAREWHAPWIPDYRDLWSLNPSYRATRWRQRMDMAWEARVLRQASAVTVAPPGAAEDLRKLAPQLKIVPILNGYDADDLRTVEPRSFGAGLHIVHTGTLYQGKRDPAPLIRAMADSPALGDVVLHLVGDVDLESAALAQSLGIADRVISVGRLSLRESWSYVAGADVALLLSWNDPANASAIPGKVFEYIGLRKAILSIGYGGGDLGSVLSRYGCFLHSNEPQEIGRRLPRLMEMATGERLRDCTATYEQFSRAHQLSKWQALLEDRFGS